LLDDAEPPEPFDELDADVDPDLDLVLPPLPLTVNLW
jgi:hypothetical protein